MEIDDMWDDDEDVRPFVKQHPAPKASPASVPEVSQIVIAYTSEDRRFTFVATKHMTDGSTLIIDEHVAFVGAEGCWVINAAAPSAEDHEDAERYRKFAAYLVGDRTDLDDAFVAARSKVELDAAIDTLHG